VAGDLGLAHAIVCAPRPRSSAALAGKDRALHRVPLALALHATVTVTDAGVRIWDL